MQIIFAAKARSAEREHHGRAWLAWHIAALSRANRLPKLESMFAPGRAQARQTPQQMKEIIRMIHAAAGGITVKRKK